MIEIALSSICIDARTYDPNGTADNTAMPFILHLRVFSDSGVGDILPETTRRKNDHSRRGTTQVVGICTHVERQQQEC